MGQIYIIPDKEYFDESLELAKKYNCAFEYNDFFMPQVLDDLRKQEELIEYYVKRKSDFSKDTMHGAFLDITVHSMDPLIREISELRIHQSMDIAKRMGLSGVVFHTGRIGGFRQKMYLKQWIAYNYEFFCRLAEEYPSINIYMENMFDEAPDILAEFAKRMVNVRNFGICLDYAHAALTDCPGKNWVEELSPYIRHMHINDNDFSTDLHQPVGDGKIDWQIFTQLMRQEKVESSVLIEVKGIAAQKQSLEYMEQNHIYPFDKQGE